MVRHSCAAQVSLPEARGREPVYPGDLAAVLGTAPCFRPRLRGYDALQVDDYVAWAEGELSAARRTIDELFGRYSGCSAELERAHRLLAHSVPGVILSGASERVGEMLAEAADRAAEMTAAAAEECERLRTEARLEADARAEKAARIRRRELALHQSELERARREREAAEAAAAARLADVQQQVERLDERRRETLAFLGRLERQLDETLAGLAADPVASVAPPDTATTRRGPVLGARAA
jgi:chromosome segregation ATPase